MIQPETKDFIVEQVKISAEEANQEAAETLSEYLRDYLIPWYNTFPAFEKAARKEIREGKSVLSETYVIESLKRVGVEITRSDIAENPKLLIGIETASKLVDQLVGMLYTADKEQENTGIETNSEVDTLIDKIFSGEK